jgi:hypothetical protein
MPKTQPLLLDLYPNAAVAYSLRKLRNAYTGPAIRVRRSVDNADQDFGFNDFNDTLIDWVGYNLWTFSEEWDNVVWIKSGLNLTGTPPYINVETAPDSTLTADKITENTVSQAHTTSRNLAVTNGVTYNVSVYLKHGGRDVNIVSTLSSLATYSVDVDLINGTLSNNTFLITPILENVGSGWYRLSYQVTATVTQTRNVITINLRNPSAANPINYLGNGVSGVFIWGAQATATSLVRTYSKTVATANAGNGFVSIWYDQSGNSRNAEQTTPANQAQIVSNGFIIIDAVTLKPTTTWSADRYTIIGGVSPITRYLSIGVLNRTANSNVIAHIGVANAISGVNGQETFLWQPTTGTIRTDMFSAFNHGTNIFTGAFITTSEKNASNLKTVYLNGSALALTATEAPSTTGTFMNSFGQNGANFTTCQYQEYIYWNIEQSANRVAIETLINEYYAIY